MFISIDVGIKNLAICVLNQQTIHCWKIINLTYGTDLCSTIIRELEEFVQKYPTATVVIERQMTKKMLNIQCYIEMFFRLKDYSSVIIYSPKHKLAGTGMEHSGKGLYQARKRASVQLCKEWLEKYTQEDWIHQLWKSTRKKDDISDALMMAIAFQENPICDITQIKKKIISRKPTPSQQSKGNYSKSNIKYLLQQISVDKRQEGGHDKKLQRNIIKFWPSLEECLKDLEL